MVIDKRKVRDQLFADVPSIFQDGIAGCLPRTETELTAMLSVLHQRHAIRWNQVPLYTSRYESSGNFADSLLEEGGVIVSEYPLFCRPADVQIWGDMKADLMYISRDQRSVVLIENKIGGDFTSGGNDVETGQLARQMEYLHRSTVAIPHLVLLSAADFFKKKWYCSELAATVEHKTWCSRVRTHLMTWEDIFGAVHNISSNRVVLRV